MTEWTVLGVIALVAGGAWSICANAAKIITPLTRQITELNSNMNNISCDIAELTERNSKTHARLFEKMEQQGETLQSHEIRIVRLEEHDNEY